MVRWFCVSVLNRAPKAPETWVSIGTPIFFSFFLLAPLKAAQNGRRRRPKHGAEGAVPPEGEGNPAEGWSSRVYYNTS